MLLVINLKFKNSLVTVWGLIAVISQNRQFFFGQFSGTDYLIDYVLLF